MTAGQADPEVVRRHLRNVLVHGYLQVDLGILERVLRENLPELDEFAERVEAHLRQIAPGGRGP